MCGVGVVGVLVAVRRCLTHPQERMRSDSRRPRHTCADGHSLHCILAGTLWIIANPQHRLSSSRSLCLCASGLATQKHFRAVARNRQRQCGSKCITHSSRKFAARCMGAGRFAARFQAGCGTGNGANVCVTGIVITGAYLRILEPPQGRMPRRHGACCGPAL